MGVSLRQSFLKVDHFTVQSASLVAFLIRPRSPFARLPPVLVPACVRPQLRRPRSGSASSTDRSTPTLKSRSSKQKKLQKRQTAVTLDNPLQSSSAYAGWQPRTNAGGCPTQKRKAKHSAFK